MKDVLLSTFPIKTSSNFMIAKLKSPIIIIEPILHSQSALFIFLKRSRSSQVFLLIFTPPLLRRKYAKTNIGRKIPKPATINQNIIGSRPVRLLKKGIKNCVSKTNAVDAIPNIKNEFSRPIPLMLFFKISLSINC